MKKYVAILFIFIFGFIVSGCERTSVEDAYKIANSEKGQIAKNITKLNEQKEQRTYSETNDNSVQLNSDANKKIAINNIGDIIDVKGMTCQVKSVIVSTNVYDISSIADNESTNVVINSLFNDFGKDSKISQINGEVYLQDNGDVGNGYIKKILFMKICFQNNSYEKELCLTPQFYKDNGNGEFAYIRGIEALELNNDQQFGADKFYYKFATGQKVEFIIAFSIGQGVNLNINNLYLNTSFLNPDNAVGTNPTKIADGTKFIFIPLNQAKE